MFERDCSACQQCCILFEVDGIDKSENQNCPFLVSNIGCIRYNSRPSGCRSFYCTWIQGFGSDEDNPKTCGVLIQRKETNLMHEGDRLDYVAWETKSDGFKTGHQAMARVCEETGSKIAMLDLNDNHRLVSICQEAA